MKNYSKRYSPWELRFFPSQVLKDEFFEYILFQEFGYLSVLPCSRVATFFITRIFPISPTHHCPWFYAFEEVPSLRSSWKGKPLPSLPSTEAAPISDTSMVFFSLAPFKLGVCEFFDVVFLRWEKRMKSTIVRCKKNRCVS